MWCSSVVYHVLSVTGAEHAMCFCESFVNGFCCKLKLHPDYNDGEIFSVLFIKIYSVSECRINYILMHSTASSSSQLVGVSSGCIATHSEVTCIFSIWHRWCTTWCRSPWKSFTDAAKSLVSLKAVFLLLLLKKKKKSAECIRLLGSHVWANKLLCVC